ncbi:hypothetical protein KKB43_06110 [Patescibacteria group bacterium]|nr:hypothetical protein [Patescibacteria group bacterium]MBU4141917.1 hypothetical protein [Patescibacteria group bacterium]MBU4338884.1 hypothetical protein [Patescibacteria group bacterium]MBU4580554.1 hypothetical protein [Patescibacteria group bacterium]
MNKKEIIWREILHQTIENKKIDFTQKELAQKYGYSLSTTFNALKIPQGSGAVRKSGRGFKVEDKEKFLYLWATMRRFKKDIIYQTNVSEGAREIEAEMPPGVIFGCFSAYSKKYKSAPADYDKVYVYADGKTLEELKIRFPKKEGYVNLTILSADPFLGSFGKITPDVQTFADLWNLSEWYAKDFLNALKEKIL